MKLVICSFLFLFIGAYADSTVFDEQLGSTIKAKLDETLKEYKNVKNRLLLNRYNNEILEVEEDKNFRYKLSLKIKSIDNGEVTGKWDVNRVNDRLLKITAEATQKNLVQKADLIIDENLLEKEKRTTDFRPVDLKWSNIEIKLSLDVTMDDEGKMKVTVVNKEINIVPPEVVVDGPPKAHFMKSQLQDLVSKGVLRIMTRKVSEFAYTNELRSEIRKVIREMESQQQQTSAK